MDQQVLKELRRIANMKNWSMKEAEFALSHLTELIEEISRLHQYEQAWQDYQVWLRRGNDDTLKK